MKKICRTDLIAEINLDFTGSVLQSNVNAIKLQAPQASNPKATLIFFAAINLKKSAASTLCYAVCGILFNETYLEDS